jgi:DNA-binding FadR family transcriptional regulator
MGSRSGSTRSIILHHMFTSQRLALIVRIDLATHYVTEIVGAISDRDVKRAERLVARHAKQLKQEWSKIHGND